MLVNAIHKQYVAISAKNPIWFQPKSAVDEGSRSSMRLRPRNSL